MTYWNWIKNKNKIIINVTECIFTFALCYCTLHVTLSTWLSFSPFSSCVCGMTMTSFNDSTVILLWCLFQKLFFFYVSLTLSLRDIMWWCKERSEKHQLFLLDVTLLAEIVKRNKVMNLWLWPVCFYLLPTCSFHHKQIVPSLLLDMLSDTESMKMKNLCWLQK